MVHSPLVGPLTWKPIAARLEQRGLDAIVPALTSEGVRPPYWQRHVDAVWRSLANLAPAQPVILVGHSGAGPLLPAIRTSVTQPVAGYIFVDAGLPGPDGASRFDLFESREVVERVRARAKGGLLPPWTELVGATDSDLRALIPDDSLRKQFVTELRITPITIYEEPLPVSSAWPDAPCGYLKFSQAYESGLEQAKKAGWPVRELTGGHFHMLAAPDAVTDALIQLAAEMEALAPAIDGLPHPSL